MKKYGAFISYSHAADNKLAPMLQSALHRLAKPFYRLRAMRVFRDKSSLNLTPELWPLIQAALKDSEYFILMASPEAAQSKWVKNEINEWLTLNQNPVDKLLIVLTDGQIEWDDMANDFNWNVTNALPLNLKGLFSKEPLFSDLRWVKGVTDLSLRNPQFLDDVGTLGATIHDKPKDQLIGDDVRQHRRFKRVALAAGIALLVFAISASGAALYANKQRKEADRQKVDAQQQKAEAERQRQSALDAAERERRAAESERVAREREQQERKKAEQATANEKVARQQAEERRREAERQRQIAVQQKDLAVSRELAASATSQLPVDPETSILLSIEATTKSHTQEAADVLRRSLLESQVRVVLRGHTAVVNKAATSPDGRFVVTVSDDKTARIWEASSGRSVATLEHHGAVDSIAFSPDGRYVVTGREYAPYDEIKDDETGIQVTELGTGRRVMQTQGSKFIAQVAFSRDSKLVVTRGLEDKEPRVWETDSGRNVAVLRGHEGLVLDFQFSPDGRRILTGSLDHTARLWDARTGNCLVVFSTPEGHKAAVNNVAFGRDGQYVVTTSFGERVAWLWETTTGRQLAPLDTTDTGGLEPATFNPNGKSVLITSSSGKVPWLWTWHDNPRQYVGFALKGHQQRVFSARFSPNGKLIVTASLDGTARVWNVDTQETTALLLHPHAVRDAIFSPDSKFIVTTCADKATRVFDALSGELLREFRGHDDQIESVAFSRDGKFIVTASDDGTARLWTLDVSPKRGLFTLEGHETSIVNVAYSPDGRLVVGFGWGDEASIWEASTGRLVTKLKGHKTWVNSAAFSPDSRLIVTTSLDAPARVWDAQSGQILFSLQPHADRAVFSPDGRLIATFGLSKVSIWDAVSGRELVVREGYNNDDGGILLSHLKEGPFSPFNSNPFSPDSKLIVLGSNSDNFAHVCDLRTLDVLLELKGHSGSVNSASFSADGRFILTASDDETARVWDAHSGRSLFELKSPRGKFMLAKFSPNGRTIVTLGEDYEAWMWDARTGGRIAQLKGHTLAVNSVSFSPDGRLVVTGSKDITTRVWEASTGQSLLELKGQSSSIYSAAFSPDGRFVVTGSADGTAKIYNCQVCGTLRELLVLGRQRLHNTGRSFTPEERRIYLHER
jgi:WD40 repeat protein